MAQDTVKRLERFEWLKQELDTASTREHGRKVLDTVIINKSELLDFAKNFLDLPVSSSDNQARIREKVIANRVGLRLSHAAVRGRL